MLINNLNKKFFEVFFKQHKVFHHTNFPWQIFNWENGMIGKHTNLQVRCEYLFTKYGFFNETLKEKNPMYLDSQPKDDYCYYHRQRRYIVQELIDGAFMKPVHSSMIPLLPHPLGKINGVPGKGTIDLKNGKSFWNICHPGNTRFQSSAFLQKNLDNVLIYVNKDYYESGLEHLTEIKKWEDLKGIWNYPKDSVFNFYYGHEKQKEHYKNNGNTKYHKATKCNVLKVWGIKNPRTDKSTLKDKLYIPNVFKSSEKIAAAVFAKKLQIFTDAYSKAAEMHFRVNRLNLINEAKKIMLVNTNQDGKKYYFDTIDEFDFEVLQVNARFKLDDTILDDTKGISIWIDKTMVYNINRDIYELLFYVRSDVKIARTRDNRVKVVNHNSTSDKEWIIEDDFFKTETNIDWINPHV